MLRGKYTLRFHPPKRKQKLPGLTYRPWSLTLAYDIYLHPQNRGILSIRCQFVRSSTRKSTIIRTKIRVTASLTSTGSLPWVLPHIARKTAPLHRPCSYWPTSLPCSRPYPTIVSPFGSDWYVSTNLALKTWTTVFGFSSGTVCFGAYDAYFLLPVLTTVTNTYIDEYACLCLL